MKLSLGMLLISSCFASLTIAETRRPITKPKDTRPTINPQPKQPQRNGCCRLEEDGSTRGLQSLEEHLASNPNRFNTISLVLTAQRNPNKEHNEDLLYLVDCIRTICNMIRQERNIRSSNVSIRNASGSIQASLEFGGENAPLQGAIELDLGACECCTNCYPACYCPERADGTCPCNDTDTQKGCCENISAQCE